MNKRPTKNSAWALFVCGMVFIFGTLFFGLYIFVIEPRNVPSSNKANYWSLVTAMQSVGEDELRMAIQYFYAEADLTSVLSPEFRQRLLEGEDERNLYRAT